MFDNFEIRAFDTPSHVILSVLFVPKGHEKGVERIPGGLAQDDR